MGMNIEPLTMRARRLARLPTLSLGFLATMAMPVMAIEEPAFNAIGQSGAVELRDYAATLVAETRVSADFAEAGNLAFRPLFSYISGNNRRRESIEMTAPVSQSPARATNSTIDMTAPVTQRRTTNDGGHVVAFAMPANYTIDTIPQPLDGRVSIRAIPARTMAVLAYSGTWSETRYTEHERLLREEIVRAGWRARGETEFARYDPPMMPWFLRRNEVMVEIDPPAPASPALPATPTPPARP